MGKKFKNTICVYCGTPSAMTRDHVFARGFFLPRRGNLPIVPACEPCNKMKSDLEHYLTTVLPFAGQHADAAANLETMVPRRLAKNVHLHRKLAAGLSRTWAQEAGVFRPSLTLPFEPEKLEELFVFIAKGLAWHHWRALITGDTDVWAGILTGTGERQLTSYMALAKVRCARDLGDGTFSYEGVQASDNPRMTVWTFSVYGGFRLTGAPDAPHEHFSRNWRRQRLEDFHGPVPPEHALRTYVAGRVGLARPRHHSKLGRCSWCSLCLNYHIPTVYAHACKMGLEGIVSKRKTSTYRSGRSAD
jgi:hypothetical protein